MPSLGISKLIASGVLALGSAVTSLVALFFSNTCAGRNKWAKCPLLLSMGLCFGAGVLLATAFNHILPEVREDIPNFAETLMCVGFFILYFIDELVHLLSPSSSSSHSHAVVSPLYQDGAHKDKDEEEMHFRVCHDIERQVYKRPSITENGNVYEMVPNCRHQTEHESVFDIRPNAQMTEVTTMVSSSTTISKRMGLLLALTIHSILEGLAIGLEMSTEKVMLLLMAVACHKFVVSGCLGAELAAQHSGRIQICSWLVGQLMIFSFGSAIGVGIGTLLVASNSIDTTHGIIIPSLQALAGGSLMYVTMCEVLPRERLAASTGDAKHWPSYSGLLLNIAIVIGYVTMLLLNFILSEP